jgi:TolB protein
VSQGAFPGQNGKIAFQSDAGGDEEIYSVNPDGTGLSQLTTNSVDDVLPAWSPDGTKMAFFRSGEASGIYVMNADGTDQHRVGPGGRPSWSPDGTKIVSGVPFGGFDVLDVATGEVTSVPAPPDSGSPKWSPDGRTFLFERFVAGGYRIWAMDVDGTDARQLTTPTCGNVPGGQHDHRTPSWAPDGSWFAYHQREFNPDADCFNGLVLRRFDGSSGSFVPDSEDYMQPEWSPDRTRLVAADFFSEDIIYTLPLSGTGYQIVAASSTGFLMHPDWQPLPVNTPSNHQVPLAANKLRASLVPAFTPCTSPNREHGPPLVGGSCSPPQPRSTYLSLGGGSGSPPSSVGKVSIRTRLGTPGGADDTDVNLRLRLTNVMRAADLSEYTGEVLVSATVRVTDWQGGDGPTRVSSTIRDFPLEFDATCVSTPTSPVKSTCAANTTLDALIPGSTPEGTYAVWAIDQVKVYDAGPDENTATAADNAALAVQGVFVP